MDRGKESISRCGTFLFTLASVVRGINIQVYVFPSIPQKKVYALEGVDVNTVKASGDIIDINNDDTE